MYILNLKELLKTDHTQTFKDHKETCNKMPLVFRVRFYYISLTLTLLSKTYCLNLWVPTIRLTAGVTCGGVTMLTMTSNDFDVVIISSMSLSSGESDMKVMTYSLPWLSGSGARYTNNISTGTHIVM